MTNGARGNIKRSLGRVAGEISRKVSRKKVIVNDDSLDSPIKSANDDGDSRKNPDDDKKNLAKINDINVNEDLANELPEEEEFEIEDDEIAKQPSMRKRSIARRIWLILCDVVFALCILLFAGAIYLSVQAKKSGEAVSVLGYRPFLIATGSMEPTFAINGFVLTHDDDFAKIKIGDVVAFKAEGLNGQPALHRVLAITGNGQDEKLYVKGDNNPMPDGMPVTRENYIGKAVFNTNLTATYINILRGPYGIAKAVVLPVILLLLLYFGARFLIDGASDWRTKGIAICVVVLLISAGVLASYTIYNFKQVDYTNSSLATIADKFAKSGASTNWTVNGQKVIGRIEIPSLKLDYPIIEYSAATSLDVTIAQFSGAGVNLDGNEVLVGHRAFGDLSAFNLFFTNIDQLKKGDEIYLTGTDRKQAKYVVEWSKVVSPEDNSVLSDDGATRQVTLIATTYDLKNRFVVRAVAE